MNSRSRCRQPPHGTHGSSPSPITAASAIRVWPAATSAPIADVSAHCPCGYDGVLDVGADVDAAVLGAQGDADAEVGVRRVGERVDRARGGRQVAVGRRRQQPVGVGVGEDPRVVEAERLDQPRHLVVLAREVRVRRARRPPARGSCPAPRRGRGGCAPPPTAAAGAPCRRRPACRARRRAPRAARPRPRRARSGSGSRAPRRRRRGGTGSARRRPGSPRAASGGRRGRRSRCRAARACRGPRRRARGRSPASARGRDRSPSARRCGGARAPPRE